MPELISLTIHADTTVMMICQLPEVLAQVEASKFLKDVTNHVRLVYLYTNDRAEKLILVILSILIDEMIFPV